METRVSAAEKSDTGGIRTAEDNHQEVCGRKKAQEESNERLSGILYKTTRHFFPYFTEWLKKIKDPRNPEKITYELQNLIWEGLLLYICKLSARRQIKYNFNTPEFKNNLNLIAETSAEQVGHPDTLGYFLERLNPNELHKFRTRMIRSFIRQRCLEKYRLLGKYYLIVMDGTGHLVFKKRHCKHCLSMKQKKGTNIYLHKVLEAKLVCSNGLAFSIGTEFIENADPKSTAQDCELKAFYRLAEKLKKDFPQLNICLLLDSLYAASPEIETCEKNNWKYIITFKKGSMPDVYQRFEKLKQTEKDYCEHENNGIKQKYSLVTDILYYKEKTTVTVNVLECLETNPDGKETKFVWLTNFEINKQNYLEIANGGGRLRWKIENEGFNIQKNGGYNLEHAYSEDNTGIKNFYLLLQIAHILSQLVENGSLLVKEVKKMFGSIRNFSSKILESLRREVLSLEELTNKLSHSFQIRFYDKPP